ncbi:MAG: histidinol phosphatase [Candidatus Nanopelagicales bacterium]|jgi:histidinol-phosphatase|nr:histidinol phosphatase [Candidatus Nanopelagicales bacterium]
MQQPARPGGDDLALALALADAADAIALDRYRAADLVVETKPDLTPVTEADRAVEAALRAMLAEARPEDPVLGEEFGGAMTGATRQWVIDPIDATKNYVRGVPVWATLIGLLVEGRAEVGVVSAPALGRRWWAARGAGAHTRGPDGERTLHVSAVRDLADASLSFSDHVGWRPGALAALTHGVWRARAYGDFWSHLLVAEGAVDVAAEPELNIWDVAGLVAIVEEAGGRITGVDGSPALGAGSGLTTNGLLHQQVLDVLAG